jgi:hypothetical protein
MNSLKCIRPFAAIAMLAVAAQALADNDAIRLQGVSDPHAATSQGTAVNGINLFGVVVGNYGDANNVYHAMVATPPYSKSSFITIDGPGSPQLTNAWGINFEGSTTGFYVDTDGVFHGFVAHPPYSTVQAIDVPGACSSGAACANLGTQALSINLEGTIAGYYLDANGVAHGFVSERPYTNFKAINPPGACSTGPACANLGTAVQWNSLNDFGAITGVYYDVNGVAHGFVSHPPYSTFKTFDVPGACSLGPTCYGAGTQPSSINLAGTITGLEVDASGISHHGFVSDPPYTRFKIFDAPGACSKDVAACAGLGTAPQSIDVDGTIVGYFADAHAVHHGFVSRRPYTGITAFDDPSACSSGPACGGAGTFPYANDPIGGIAGAAVDSVGASHGFVGHQN